VEPFATAVGLAAAGGLLLVATLLSPVSQRLGVPVLLLVLAVGMAAGSEGLGRIPFDDHRLAFRAGIVALVLILFDGGLGTPRSVLRRALPRALMLATLGVVLTAVVVAVVAIALGFPPALAVLVGAVVSSTDAAAVFSVLRGSGVRLRETTGATLEIESGLNDPIALLLTVVATEIVLGEGDVGLGLVAVGAMQLVLGAVFGVAIGRLGRALLHWVVLPAAGLYPVLTVAIALLAYGAPTLVDGSGFLAAYVAGLVLAGGPLPYRPGIRRVHDALAWLSQLAMFLLLGLLVFPSRLLATAPAGLLLAAALLFLARPLAVFLCFIPFRASLRERVFVAWVGLRGAVPIVLATYPVLRGVAQGDVIFHVVFFVVLANGLVPGATVGWLARRFGLAAPETTVPAAVELVSLREYPGEFVWYTLDRASAVAGATIDDLPLPDGCVLTLLLRNDAIVAMREGTRFRPDDHVCVFVRHEERAFVDLLFGRGEEDAV
jgi:cell volume regulation protein A